MSGIIEAIREKYKAKRKAEKADIRIFMCNQTLKMYSLKTETHRCIGYKEEKNTTSDTYKERKSEHFMPFIHEMIILDPSLARDKSNIEKDWKAAKGFVV